jgi:hypothetical protein
MSSSSSIALSSPLAQTTFCLADKPTTLYTDFTRNGVSFSRYVPSVAVASHQQSPLKQKENGDLQKVRPALGEALVT